MQWKAFSVIVLAVLTLAVFVNNTELGTNLYLKASGPGPPVSDLRFLPNVNTSNLGELGVEINDYIVCSSGTYIWIIVSDDWCPIRSWAESLYNNGTDQFYVVINNQTYITLFTTRQGLENPVEFNEALFITTALMWGALGCLYYIDKRKQALPQKSSSQAEREEYETEEKTG